MNAPQPDPVLALLAAATHADDALLLDLLALALEQRRRDVVWLALALLRPILPTQPEVQRLWRALRLDGPQPALAAERGRPTTSAPPWPASSAELPALHDRLVLGGVLVDVHHTATHSYRTGIQRVVIETIRRWSTSHAIRAIAWTDDWAALRDLEEAEHQRVLAAPARLRPDWGLVPWNCTYLLPEVAGDLARTQHLAAMVESGVVRLGLIAFDLIPVTAAETAAAAMPGAFASYLGVVKHATNVAAISAAAATEYLGFCDMLVGQDLTGPTVTEVPLPTEAVHVDAAGQLRTRAGLGLGLGDSPFILAVGTHEPRKNHLALLHAAELLWRDGLVFSVVLLGSNGWGSEEFVRRSAELQAAGRPLLLVTSASDEVLWGSYHAARVVAFPSIHEGFGLPVAEALACGTPVVTSNIGSMLQLAVEGGALVVDPHDDRALAEALRAVLTDDALHAELSAAARARSVRTWDAYAAEVWQALVGPDHP